jgi:hypothetical protein
VQVDPVTPTLKPPGTKRLNVHHDILLSTFAFKLNMRRYNEADWEEDEEEYLQRNLPTVGRCRLTLSNPR